MISFNHKMKCIYNQSVKFKFVTHSVKVPKQHCSKKLPHVSSESVLILCIAPFSINGSVQSFVIVVYEAPNSYRWYCCPAQSFWQKPLCHSKSLVIFRETFLSGGTKLSAKAHISDFQISDHHFRLPVGPLSYIKLAWSFTEKYLLLLEYKVN